MYLHNHRSVRNGTPLDRRHANVAAASGRSERLAKPPGGRLIVEERTRFSCLEVGCGNLTLQQVDRVRLSFSLLPRRARPGLRSRTCPQVSSWCRSGRFFIAANLAKPESERR
jgi:hypothetical protein